MGVLDAFVTTWSQARRTFGDGVPTGGSSFDRSETLLKLRSDSESAAPDTRWTGEASDSYAARNEAHAQTFGALADLDARLAVEVDKSAEIVTGGRADLDIVRDWVFSAASSLPDGPAGEAMLMTIVSQGMADLADVLVKSNGELNVVGGTITQIGTEYAGLGNQRLPGGAFPEQPVNEDELPPIDPLPPILDAATWRIELEDYNIEATAHNSAVAAHARSPVPPINSPAYPAYVARTQSLESRHRQLEAKRIELVQQAAELGIEVPESLPPPDFGRVVRQPGASDELWSAPLSSPTGRRS